jgi:DNA topoisomerase-2
MYLTLIINKVQMPTIEQTYQKKNLHEHVLSRPDSYIGSIKNTTEMMWVSTENDKIEKKMIKYNPGLLKIFDEILVNAVDHSVRDPTVKNIKVTIEDSIISIKNDGTGVPVVMHSEYKIYVPELIFGNLLTGSNYNDSEERVVGGVNGIGSKATNIYSKKFRIKTVDSKSGLSYQQDFSNNMFSKKEPIVKKTKESSYTEITFEPDYPRFGYKELTDDNFSLMKRRVFDIAATSRSNLNVYFNGTMVKIKEFKNYIDLYPVGKVYYSSFTQGKFIWEYAVSLSESYSQVSFVNGISTNLGGKHVDYIMSQIVKKLGDMMIAKKKVTDIKSNYIKDRLFIFVRATVINPSFSNQSKDTLTTNSKDFGVKFEVPESFIKDLFKSGIVEDIVSFTDYKNKKLLGKVTDGKKKNKINIPKLDDANFAGTSRSNECTLLLTEGDSAKTFGVAGLSVIGRDRYGLFPLKGKALNSREATQTQLLKNEEITNIKKILGLQVGKKYKDTNDLRYGSITLLTDADFDGIHIQGLIINILHFEWPELLEIKGFIRKMKTPILKVTNKKIITEFFTEQSYNIWNEKNASKGNVIKYYKGLGTSTSEEAKKLFKKFDKLIVNYNSSSKKDTEKAILLAFEKKQADNRKIWLSKYNHNLILDQSDHDVSYSEFVDKELIHFSIYDTIRSIPNLIDGLKPSQRKIIYTILNKNYTKEIKVAQFGAAVAEYSGYHHGEVSLYGAIINLAQNYVGSNNMNLLEPNGQFGSRLLGGKDAASPRYIFTELSSITKKIFLKEDNYILKDQYDDGDKIEPVFYVPVLPVILINGAQGIGTGYSTNIPSFNPIDIKNNILNIINGKNIVKMTPWYKGFTGKIEELSEGSYEITGVYKRLSDTTIQITELPIGVWINDYKEFLESLIETGIIKSFKNECTEAIINFTVKFNNANDLITMISKNLMKTFKLIKPMSTRNMYLFDENSSIKKYDTSEDILQEFVKIRLKYNKLRKEYQLGKFNEDLILLSNKVRFINEIIAGDLVVFKKKKDILDAELSKRDYIRINGTYDYLTSMPIYVLTFEKIKDLEEKHLTIIEKIKDLEGKTVKRMLFDDIRNI